MNQRQRQAAAATIVVLFLSSVAVPYRYAYYNQLCRITTMCGSGKGGETLHGTRYAPLWAPPTNAEVEQALVLDGNAALPTAQEVELDTGRLALILLAVGLLGGLSIVALGRRVPDA